MQLNTLYFTRPLELRHMDMPKGRWQPESVMVSLFSMFLKCDQCGFGQTNKISIFGF